MSISYSESFYTTPRTMQAEEKILNYFEFNRVIPLTMEDLLALTGETPRTVERALTQIRRYPGYKVEVRKKNRLATYRVLYTAERDPWVQMLSTNQRIGV